MNKLIKGFVVANVILSLSGAAALAKGNNEPVKLKKVEDLACMQSAVVKRDDAIIAAAKVHSDSLIKALETRRDALKAAWGVTNPEERQKALKSAWDIFRSSKKRIVESWREVRKSAWRQFQVDRKACRVHGASDDHVGEGIDANL
ncbi:MAG: hypothetical protein Q7S83_01605 [bacterium]|nr:hypothetical protein [bacterium]